MKPYYEDDSCQIFHGDCREVLPTLDKVDLVLTDPPYGIGISGQTGGAGKGKGATRTRDYGATEWDKEPVKWGLLWELLTLGKFACCFGGNYYPVPPSPSWIVWDKQNTGNFADCELAWTNYGGAVRIKRHLWNGMCRLGLERRAHPTQKPLDVILWCVQLCPKEPQTILDPFMGSGTTLRAAKDLQRKAIGIELEEKYCEIAAKRLSQEVLPLEFNK